MSSKALSSTSKHSLRVLVTGASGFVGAAVVRELLDAGYAVTGLARSDASAARVKELGASVHRGSLENVESLKEAARSVDGVIHTAFIHDFSNYKASCETDRRVILALGSALAGSTRPLVVTSALGILPSGQRATEDSHPPSDSPNPRAASEQAVAELVRDGVNASLIRLPFSVHGDGDHGFVPMLIDRARINQRSAYLGEGKNRWPAVHRNDAAKVYRLALGRASAGTVYHAVGEEGVAFREIAEVISRRLGVELVGLSATEASLHFATLAHFVGLDVPSSARKTEELLRWKPSGVGLLADLEHGAYFEK